MNKRVRALLAAVGVVSLLAVPVAFNAADAETNTATVYGCFQPDGLQTSRRLQLTPPVCAPGNHWESWQAFTEPGGATTTTTQPATTTSQPATTTSTAPTTTTTTTTVPGGTPTFLSRPGAACGTRLTGSNVVLSNRTLQNCSGVALTVANATNVTLTGLDFANNAGDIYLVDVTGNITISGIRARNTGNGNIGSGQSNVIQLSRSWDNDSAVDISNVKAYGGDTEDVISIFQSGGTSATNTLLIEDVHVEHPLSGDLAWSSGSGTCINLADAGGANITLRNSTFLNCAQVGIQMNEPDANVKAISNIVYGAARSGSNVGLSQWSSGDCPSTCPGNEYRTNRVWWVKSSGSASPLWLSGNYPVADISNVKQDTSINPNDLRVVL